MKFLSDEWFEKVEELKNAAGDLDIPAQLAAVTINVRVDESLLTLKGGEFVKGHDDSATTTLTLGSDLARKVFIEGDSQAGMQAFMAGEIKVEGDMSKIMELQMVQPSAKQKALLGQIKDITD